MKRRARVRTRSSDSSIAVHVVHRLSDNLPISEAFGELRRREWLEDCSNGR